jgi:hypothetical protein
MKGNTLVFIGAGILSGVALYHFGVIGWVWDSVSSFIASFTASDGEGDENEVSEAEGLYQAPDNIIRNYGSVEQVMTQTGILQGRGVGQNGFNYGVSGAAGVGGNYFDPSVEAFIDRATTPALGQNFDGRAVGLN